MPKYRFELQLDYDKPFGEGFPTDKERHEKYWNEYEVDELKESLITIKNGQFEDKLSLLRENLKNKFNEETIWDKNKVIDQVFDSVHTQDLCDGNVSSQNEAQGSQDNAVVQQNTDCQEISKCNRCEGKGYYTSYSEIHTKPCKCQEIPYDRFGWLKDMSNSTYKALFESESILLLKYIDDLHKELHSLRGATVKAQSIDGQSALVNPSVQTPQSFSNGLDIISQSAVNSGKTLDCENQSKPNKILKYFERNRIELDWLLNTIIFTDYFDTTTEEKKNRILRLRNEFHALEGNDALNGFTPNSQTPRDNDCNVCGDYSGKCPKCRGVE